LICTSYDAEADALFVWFPPEGMKSAGTEGLDVRERLGVPQQSEPVNAAE
jgi:hypothetical protein